AIVGFAQVNGRLPCPAIPTSGGIEDGGGTIDCNNYGGFVPVNTLGYNGRLNSDMLLLDPWGNPYRYYVSNQDINGGGSDFVTSREMRAVGLVDVIDVPGGGIPGTDTYIDLDGQYLICDAAGTSTDDLCTGAAVVFGRPNAAGGPYAGAPFVLLSLGKNGSQTPVGDELENRGTNETNDATLAMGLGPSNDEYWLKNVAGNETTFVRRNGLADDFDDVVKWVSPNLLFSKMIEANQLP
ncbi:MAG: hypothetical protein OEY09_20130, partial [Gammaproteobacteria bacterium]|nr:hypothetical protein [Gammaproteobacteria bacterium]